MDYQNILKDEKIKSRYIWDIIKTKKNNNHLKNTIPKVIVQYWDNSDNIPNDVLKCMETWETKCNDKIEYKLFDRENARNFIKNNFTKMHIEAFDNCFHPALQSDYFRLCYILINGGVYIDADDECMCNDVNFLFDGNMLKVQAMCYDIKKEKMIDTKKAYQENFSHNRIYYVNNNPLIAPKNNIVIEKALQFATNNLLKPFENDFQSIAGPGNIVNSIIWCILNKKDLGSIIDIDTNWDSKVISKWPLEYRSDNRNWRNLRLDKRQKHE